MYNLFVSANKNSWNGEPFVIEKERCINSAENTDSKIAEEFQELNIVNIEKIKKFPCIFAYESQCNKNPKFGYIEEINERTGNNVRIKYKIINLENFLTYTKLLNVLVDIDIQEWEMNRTHWAIKDVDLHKELIDMGIKFSTVKTKEEQGVKEEIMKLSPEVYGVGINLKALWKKIVRVKKTNRKINENSAKRRKKPEIKITVVIACITLFVAIISIPWWPYINPQRVSLLDVEYVLADENGSIIRRWNWQDRPIFNSKGENISRMVLSIKLRNPNSFGLFAHIKNEKEISDMKYVEDITGDFQNENYLIPANGNTGFIFELDITPFTKITTLTKQPTNTQEIEIYNDEGEYIDTVESNLGKVYGFHIPYEIDILNDKEKIIDTINFRIRCRAIVGELKATLSDDIEGASGTMSKTLDFECIPTN